MKYATFKVTEDAKVNEFLAANGGRIARDGVAFLDGHVCILYEDRDDEQIERDGVVVSIKTFISQQLAQLLGADVDERFWRRLALRAHPKAENNVLEAAGRRENLSIGIGHARQILAEVESGKWPGTIEQAAVLAGTAARKRKADADAEEDDE